MNHKQLEFLRDALTHFASVTAYENAAHHAIGIANFIASEPRPWSRATLAGHITASAWVIDRTRMHAALIHHRKLNRWLQPGGHVEDADATWRAAAQREVTEETGLADFIAQQADGALFDVDVHPIPTQKDESAHFHYDLRFLFVAAVDATADRALIVNADEALDCRWFALAELASDPAMETSMRRMIELSLSR